MESYENSVWSLKDVFVHVACCVFGVGILFFEPAIRVFGLTMTFTIGLLFIMCTLLKNIFLAYINMNCSVYAKGFTVVYDAEGQKDRSFETWSNCYASRLYAAKTPYDEGYTVLDNGDPKNGILIEDYLARFVEPPQMSLNEVPIAFADNRPLLENIRGRCEPSILGDSYRFWRALTSAAITGASALSLGLLAHSLLASLMAFVFSTVPVVIQPITTASFLLTAALVFHRCSSMSSLRATNMGGLLFVITHGLTILGYLLDGVPLRINWREFQTSLSTLYRPQPILAAGMLIAGLYKCEPFESCLPGIPPEKRIFVSLVMAGVQTVGLFVGCLIGVCTANIGGFYGTLLALEGNTGSLPVRALILRSIITVFGVISSFFSLSGLEWHLFNFKPIFKRLSVTIASVLLTLLNSYVAAQDYDIQDAMCMQAAGIQLLMATLTFIGIPLQFILEVLRNISWRGKRAARWCNIILIVLITAAFLLLLSEKACFSPYSSLIGNKTSTITAP